LPDVPAIPPVVALAVLLALLATQVAYMLAPSRAGYLLRLLTSAVAVGIGEAVGTLGLYPHLAVGDLHPLPDLVILAAAHWSLTRLRLGVRPIR
jgi:hypothetical protein